MTSEFDTLPSIVPVSRFLIQTPYLIVALSHLAAYPGGCILEIQISGKPGGSGPAMHTHDAFEQLVFAVQFGEEITAVLDGWHHVARNKGPLQLSHSASTSGESAARADSRLSLRLHPLPPPQPGNLSIIAPDLGPQLAPCLLDGQAIIAAAQHAQPYWQ